MNTTQWILGLAATAATILVAACGGGGGGSGGSGTPASTATSYTAVAAAGELITYNVNPTDLTYSYTITVSQFGLTGKTGSGTLFKLADGTYTASNAGNARIAILPNGLLLAAVQENFGGTVKTVPVIGLSNPVTSFAAIAGSYNFVQRACVSVSCFQVHGTFVARADGTWSSCAGGNLAVGPCPTTGSTGILNNLGNGRFQIIDSNGSVNIGTAIAFASNTQNVVIADLKDSRNPGFGTGILVGSQQQTINPGAVDGTWVASGTNGVHGSFKITGTNIQYQDINGSPSSATSSVTYNIPWAGMGTTSGGGVGLLAGSGVYVLGSGLSYAEIGIKVK